MALKIITEEYVIGVSGRVVLKYTPDPTWFNAEGIEHFGKDTGICGCESCGRLSPTTEDEA